MMKHEKLVGRQGEFGVSLPVVVGEFYFVGAVQQFHDGAYLSSQQPFRWHIREKGHDVE